MVMYKEAAWLKEDPCSGYQQLKLFSQQRDESNLNNKILNYLEDTSNDISVEKAAELFGYSEPFCRKILKELRESRQIKIVKVVRRNINLIGIYKSITSPDTEFPVITTGKDYMSVCGFLEHEGVSKYENAKAMRYILKKNKVSPKIAFSGNCRFVEVYATEVLKNTLKNLTTNPIKSKVVNFNSNKKESIVEELIRSEIIRFLKSQPNSLKSDLAICLPITESLLTKLKIFQKVTLIKKVKKVLNKLCAESLILFTITSTKEELYQLEESLVWENDNFREVINLDEYMSVSTFYEKYISKKTISKNSARNKVERKGLSSIEIVANNKKRVLFYSILELNNIFKKYLRERRKGRSHGLSMRSVGYAQPSVEPEIQVEVEPMKTDSKVQIEPEKNKESIKSNKKEKTLFKFKFFGKEISLTVNK